MTPTRSFVRSRRTALKVAAGSALVASAPFLKAQDAYPTKTITLIVPFAPGGIADLTARAVAQQMSTSLKQTIVVDNRPSAGSVVGSQMVANAQPDGYTLGLISNGNAVSASLFKKLPFDMMKDFAPIATLGYFDLGVFLNTESKYQKLSDVVAYAKQNPGKLTIGTIAIGSTQNLSAELFKTVSGIDAVIVPYKGTPAVLQALRAGEIDMAFEILGPWMGQLQAKAVRIAAVTSDRRFTLLPDVPTVQEAGFPSYNVASWNALAAPAKTPPAIIERLNKAANEAVRAPAVIKQLEALGVRPEAGSPEQLTGLLTSEIKKWGDVIRASKIEQQ